MGILLVMMGKIKF